MAVLVNIDNLIDTRVENNTNAQLAITGAATATTKANEASVSASNASTSETNASDSASSASTSATTATTQAGIATTKASEASTSASNASTSESNALSYRNTTETYKNAAESAKNAAESALANIGPTVQANETTTSLSLAANTLTYIDEDGVANNIDISLYLDDTNLARLTSGTLDSSTGIATFTRDDASTFTLDLSNLLDNQIASEVPVDPISGLTSTDTQSALMELVNKIDVNKQAIASLATSQGSFESNGEGAYPIAINTTNKVMPFTVVNQSNDTNIFEIDGSADTVTFKQDRRYTFVSSVTIQDTTANGSTADITFRLVDTSDNSLFASQHATVAIGNDDIVTYPFNTEIEVTTAPLTLRFEVVSNISGYNLVEFNTVVASQGGDMDSSIILYNNATSGLSATNVQDAIDEINSNITTISEVL